ncbi:hypothetical protein VP01_1365g4 [Puccinia sorghi]|uniref:FCP1 homology domain-containing protein n=1 Tax=Puccinia sorghi TaxID=27349 RepID=A0A0L6VM04_9BASI|nr:hypothetical protein VP01_1365g4 [Puccinia sorghi]
MTDKQQTEQSTEQPVVAGKPLSSEQEPTANQHSIAPEEPTTASREGTYHTIATTADQTLVDNNEVQSSSNQANPPTQPPPQTTAIHGKELSSTAIPHKTEIPILPETVITSLPAPSSLQQQPSQPTNPTLTQPPNPSSQFGPSSPTTQRASRQSKTPTRKKLIRFLLPCFHPSLHDEPPSTVIATPSRPPPPPHHPLSSSQEMAEAPAGVDQTLGANNNSSLQPSGTTTRRSPMLIAKQHLRKHRSPSSLASSNYTRRTPSSQGLPTPVSDTVTPAGAAAATSAANAHGGGGVQVPIDETEGVLSGAVVPPGKDTMAIRKSASALRLVARNHSHADNLAVAAGAHQASEKADTDETSLLAPDDPQGFQDIDDSEDDEEDRIVAMGGMGIPLAPDGTPRPLLAPLDPSMRGRKCLVLDLDETLVHSSFKVIPQSDFVVPVEIENAVHNVHVIKRPGVDDFMKKMGAIYEVVVFTASLSKYADPVLDMLDIHHVVKHRLFRESCYNHKGNYVKDLSQLGRPIAETIIIDNSPASYVFHPNNAVPVSSWFNDPHDTELTDLAAFLADIANVPDVRGILDPRL